MAMDRFLIAPFDEGLETDLKQSSLLLNASSGRVSNFTRRCIMARSYAIRKDTVDETGNKYGMLRVIERDLLKKELKHIRGAYWICECECGSKTSVCGGRLRNGKAKSCGCLRERTIENTGINRLMLFYKNKSWAKRRVFNLSKEVFYKLIKGNCFYCGIEPKQVLKRQKTDLPQIVYNGIDRIDSKKPYVPSNCVSCCKRCNSAKSDMTLEDFKNHIRKVYKWLLIDG